MAVALAYQEFGDGEPLVILHGLFGSARNWRSVAQRLAGSYHVYTVDLRNHGRSPWAETMTFADMAEDLRLFLDTHDLETAIILGHSVGGKTAMTFALEHPDRTEALIVVDIAPVAYDHTFLPLVQAMQALDLGSLKRRSEAEARLVESIPDTPTRNFLLQNLVMSKHRLKWRINLDAIGHAMSTLTDFPDDVREEYEGRALFIGGERSDYITREHHDAIFALFPQAEFAVIANAGHRVHVEQLGAFLTRVIGFLESGYA
jgi:pimeloyl-ACP methyl ester carboxylesterase